MVPGLGPVVTGVDAAIQAKLQREKHERLGYLIECLESGSDDFGGPIPFQYSAQVLHAAYVTIEATLRTSRREKIRLFAKLLKSGLVDPPIIDLENEYEDYLKILDDLSIRELQYLYLLNSYETEYPIKPDESDIHDWVERHWGLFEDDASRRLRIPKGEFSGLTARLVRTGLFETVHVARVGGDIVYEGVLTGVYKRLAHLLGNDADYFDSGTIPR
jgi:hypothetical protein